MGEGQKCWKGYEKKGTKMMFGKRYNNCVKKEEFSDWRNELGYEGKDDSKKLQEDDMKGMSVKSGHKRPTKSGAGMTKKGVEAYRRQRQMCIRDRLYLLPNIILVPFFSYPFQHF